MARNLLKDNATFLDSVLRMADLLFMLAPGAPAYWFYFDWWNLPGRYVAARLRASPWSGLNVRGFYDDDAHLQGTLIDGFPMLGNRDRIADNFERASSDQVWIALPLRAEKRVREVLDRLRQTSAVVRFVPDIYSFHLLHHSVTEVAGMPVLNLTDSPHTGVHSTLKALEDFVLASLLLAASLPLWLLIAIGIKLSSPGPIFYRQQRVTWNGHRFGMLKFRSMPQDAEGGSGPVQSQHGERRATSFGAFLRRYSLDELPQLFNVLAGTCRWSDRAPSVPSSCASSGRRFLATCRSIS